MYKKFLRKKFILKDFNKNFSFSPTTNAFLNLIFQKRVDFNFGLFFYSLEVGYFIIIKFNIL